MSLNRISHEFYSAERIKIMDLRVNREFFESMKLRCFSFVKEEIIHTIATIYELESCPLRTENMIPRSYCIKCNAKYNTETLASGQMFVCQRCQTTVVVGQKTTPEPFGVPSQSPQPQPQAQGDHENSDPMIGKTIDGVTISKPLGKGAAGIVYYGRRADGSEVALKTMHPKFATKERIVKRFIREAKSGMKLKHKHFVEFYSWGEYEGYNYIIMEFVDGCTLKELLKNNDREMNDRTKLLVGLHVAKALAFAFERNMVHRDIKPDNIMITNDGVAKLTDMGLAKEVHSDDNEDAEDMGLTKTGVTLGTPYYMPPEQIQDSKRADCRSDIYALGATLFHLFAGRPPFFGGGMMDVMKKIMEDPTPKLIDVNPEIPQNISDLVYRMIERSVDDRYVNPQALLKDFQRVLDGKPVMSQDELLSVLSESEDADIGYGSKDDMGDKDSKGGFFGKLLKMFGIGKK
ncbi:MAG: hypothetical protein COA79_02985 [Planctomycetota bacterium]|nr:MAG: hypothetical protein COA79_02985 [Planctomycetota bacterium]